MLTKKYLWRMLGFAFGLLLGTGLLFSTLCQAASQKPSVKVNYHQVELGEVQTESTEQWVEIMQDVQNNGDYPLKKVKASFRVEAEIATETDTTSGDSSVETRQVTKTVTATAERCPAGDSVVLLGSWQPDDGYVLVGTPVVREVMVYLYSGTGVVVRNLKNNTTKIKWGTKDNTPPVISGIVGSKAYNEHYQVAYRTVYKSYKKWLLKYVSARDNRDGKVKVTVDTSEVNWSKKGVQTVYYVAKDSSGNVKRVATKVNVRQESNYLDRRAQSILDRITRPYWSDTRKARAIYRYVRGSLSYHYSADDPSWETAASRALSVRSGNCMRYFGLGKLLLSRCGILNGTITRWKGYGHHWWNYVYVKNGWYHFDTTPRSRGGTFCLRTSAWMRYYSSHNGNSHIWNPAWVPAGATRGI